MRKNILTFIYVILLLLLVFLFQLYIVNTRELFGIKPNIILISVTVVSIWFGIYVGTFYSFFVGLLMDVMYMNSYGFFTISYTIVGIIIGLINSNYIRENKISLVYLTFISTTVFEITQYIEYLFITGTYSNLLYFIKQVLLSSVLNVIIVYVLYGAIRRIIEFFGDSKNNREYL